MFMRSPASVSSPRRLLRHALVVAALVTLLTALIVSGARSAVALRAYSSDVLWDDSWVSGSFVNSGAPMYVHDPDLWVCSSDGGCPPVALSDHAGQAVGIVCRRDPEGYLKIYYATDQESAWVFAADLHTKGSVPACGFWDW